MNITTHPLWIFIFPRRHNPPARFNHAANLSARALIRRFFSVRLSATGYNRNADIDFTLSRILADGPSSVWEIFPRTRPPSCVSLHYVTAFPLSLWLIWISKFWYLQYASTIPSKIKSRPSNTRPWWSIDFLSLGDAVFRANFLRCRSRFVIFLNLPTSIINNLINIALSASKIQRIWKVMRWKTQYIPQNTLYVRDILRTSLERF